MQILAVVLGLVSLACWIMVVVKVFQSGNTLMGVLCICPLVAFIYGWTQSGKLDLQTIMLVWTAIIVINLILTFMMRGQAVPA